MPIKTKKNNICVHLKSTVTRKILDSFKNENAILTDTEAVRLIIMQNSLFSDLRFKIDTLEKRLEYYQKKIN